MTDNKYINPTYDERGEPMCSEKCSLFVGKKMSCDYWENVLRWCKFQDKSSRFSDTLPYPCIPALRRDRDLLHALITRISAVTYAGEAYPISHEDELWMELIARTWKKENEGKK